VIDDPFDPFANPPRYGRVDEFENVSTQAAVEWQSTARFGVRAWAFVNRLTEQETQYDDASYRTFDRVAGSFRENVRSTAWGASAQPKLELGRAGVLTLLLSGERDGWDASGTTTLEPGSSIPIDESHTLDRYSTAVQYEVKPLDRLGVVAGYGHHWQARGAVDEDGFSALAAAHIDLGPATRFKASYGHNVRFPTLRDLYRPSQGNPALVPERADTFQAGVEQRLPRGGVASATAWYTTAHDLIQTDPASGRSTNLAEIRFAGFELAATARVMRALLLRASLTYLDSQDRSREGREEQQYTPREKLAAEATYDFGFGLSPYVSFLYLGHQYYYTRNAVTPVLKGRLEDLFLVDFKLTQRLVRNRLSVYVGATNLLDRSYETSYGFPQPGRSVYGGAELRF
jgi:outer membrane receptor protein involved in Fe transport